MPLSGQFADRVKISSRLRLTSGIYTVNIFLYESWWRSQWSRLQQLITIFLHIGAV
jgi:hypothetical protein